MFCCIFLPHCANPATYSYKLTKFRMTYNKWTLYHSIVIESKICFNMNIHAKNEIKSRPFLTSERNEISAITRKPPNVRFIWRRKKSPKRNTLFHIVCDEMRPSATTTTATAAATIVCQCLGNVVFIIIMNLAADNAPIGERANDKQEWKNTSELQTISSRNGQWNKSIRNFI